MHSLKTPTLIGLAVVLLIIAGLVAAYNANKEQQTFLSITNFDECVAAGYPIMESYPEQCMTPDGRTFENPRQRIPPPETISANGCAVAGCSGQLCISAEEAEEGGITTCEWRAEYACYREASCEPQVNGRCGWTMTPDLQKCLANPPVE